MSRRILWLPLLLSALSASPALADTHPIVLELFTSQGCSSCPPADDLLKKLSANPNILALSYHVDYWDHLGWKDPFSLKASTSRQNDYEHALGERQLFTPQLVVNGSFSTVGSRPSEVNEAIESASKQSPQVAVDLKPDQSTGNVSVHFTSSSPIKNAEIWEVHFNRSAMTQVHHGENGGRSLESIHNVTDIQRHGEWQTAQNDYVIPVRALSDDGVAVIVQSKDQGPILGASSFLKP